MKKVVVTGVGILSAFYGYSVFSKQHKLKLIEVDVEDDFKLQSVQVVFRHGARTPLESPDYLPKIKYDPEIMKHGDHTFIPYDAKSPDGTNVKLISTTQMHKDAGYDVKRGALTCKGAEQMFQLGCYLKNHYVSKLKFLSPTYNDEVYVRSTSIKRCVESARCTLAGLYPNQKVPIPIEIAKLENEVLFPNFKKCQYLDSLTHWSWFFPDLVEGIKEERQQIQTALGIPSETDVHIITLRDCLVAHHFHDVLPAEFNIPELIKRADMAAMKIMDHVFSGYHDTREIALKLGIGPLLQLFLANMDATIARTSTTKLSLFSGHDTTLMPLLHALGIHDSLWTPFGASITLELYEKGGENAKKNHFVRVLYLHEEKVIPGCDGAMCSLDKFRKAISKYLVSEEEYREKCKVQSDSLLEKVPKAARQEKLLALVSETVNEDPN